MSAILKKQGIETNEFNIQELNYLLSLISKSNFEGRDVFVVADIVNKINSKIKSNEARNK
tara:strand:+ start:4949 stop:5128 length:180 start_codon:yes stop_codon:yes gene_type:complete